MKNMDEFGLDEFGLDEYGLNDNEAVQNAMKTNLKNKNTLRMILEAYILTLL